MAAFLFDHDVAVPIAALLRDAGHDAVTARSQRLDRANDAVLLLRAAQAGRMIVTHNHHDPFLLHRGWGLWSAAWGMVASHAGILSLPHSSQAERATGQLDYAAYVRLIEELLARGLPRTDKFWQWRRHDGWVQRQ